MHAMKSRRLLFVCALFAAVPLLATSVQAQTLITFDDLPLSTDDSSNITNGYQGLIWSNFSAFNAIQVARTRGSNGYYNGMVSASNVAFNAFGNPAEIDSPGPNFNFLSAYLTGAWNSNLNIQVQGFSGGNLVYDQTVVVSATNPTFFTFNYLNVDRLYFNSFGGENAGFSESGEQFVMDNFDFEFIPEPSPFLLTAAGALMLWSLLKRKRVT
jgi:hypothetical protein